MLHVRDLEPGGEVFSWNDPDTGKTFHFAIYLMRKFLQGASLQVYNVALLPKYCDWLEINRGVNTKHAMSLTPEQLREPSILLDMGTHLLLADGSHRVYNLSKSGATTAPSYILQSWLWEHFLIIGAKHMSEEDILALPADRLKHRKV